MTDEFADERIRFYLRNQDDIRTWAAIESDAIAATRDLLGSAQVPIAERLLAVDPHAIVGRYDNGPWERILARHEDWPPTVGLALEWSRTVDPAGVTRPKLGVFWWADPAALEAPRSALVQVVDKPQLEALGYKVPLEGVWPIGARTIADKGWWTDSPRWLGTIVDQLVATWPLVAPSIDRVLVGVSWQ